MRTTRRVWVAVPVVMAVGLLAWAAGAWAEARALAELRHNGDQRLALYASSIRNAVGRYDYLPFVLARDKDVLALLAYPTEARQDEVNRALEATNDAAGSASLFIIDRTGHTLAASNWQDPRVSLVGQDYPYRPYFREAVERGAGAYFGIGVTTRLPGYFRAHAAHGPEGLLGVAVVKIDLEPVQRDWAAGGERVMVSDENGIVFLASRPEWKYGSLAPLSDAVRMRLGETRQYLGYAVTPLGMAASDEAGEVVTLGDPDDGPRRRFLMQALALPEFGWTIRFLSDLEPVRLQAKAAMGLTAMAALLLAATALLLGQRRQAVRLQREAHEALEQRVTERTRDLTAANARLQEEIAERERAETARHAAQEELVQAGKLAALGQMSAALAHEFNQPLSAIRTFIASSRVFLERGDTATVDRNLGMIADLAGRMAVISGYLKTFARKGPARVEPVAVATALDRALLLLSQRLHADGIELVRAVPAAAVVRGDAVRLEQVLVNLIRNAADAMAGCDERRLTVSAAPCKDERGENGWEIRIADTGCGIAEEHWGRLFDPFFTTKEVGEGLGLGLSLSYGIVRDFGGAVRAENNAGGGASFIIQLPGADHG